MINQYVQCIVDIKQSDIMAEPKKFGSAIISDYFISALQQGNNTDLFSNFSAGWLQG